MTAAVGDDGEGTAKEARQDLTGAAGAYDWEGDAASNFNWDDSYDPHGLVLSEQFEYTGEGWDEDPGEAFLDDTGEDIGGEPLGEGPGDDTEEGPPPPARPRRHRRRRRLLIGFLALLAVLIVAGTVGFFHVSGEINPPGHPGRRVTVEVPKGASTVHIAHLLAKVGVIDGPDVFEVYLKLEGGGPLLAGTYHLRTNQSYSAVISELENGPAVLARKLVIPEGFTIRQMAFAVARLHVGISAQAFRAAATGGQVTSVYEPPGTRKLEGLLFPATYDVPVGESADELVQWMVDTFRAEASQLGLAAAAKKLHYTPYQVVTVASIIEREAKLEPDRGPIASVIYNRLARGIPLGADSTLLYGLGDPRGPVNMETPNPYNTRLIKGLPPTPISNPGAASLEAAMHPPKTNYLYWVEINPDGKMGFASTPAQFSQLQHQCRAVHLC
ncbi:MAG: endolytic transglycosylase MltG [Acidimicrobiales bacterium]